MLIQVVLFEAAQRYWWSLEGFERFKAQERWKLSEHLSRELEKTDLSFTAQACLFEAGNLRAEWVCQPGYIACEACAWLAFNGGLEGQYELSTITMHHDPRVRSVSQHVLRMWLDAQTTPEER